MVLFILVLSAGLIFPQGFVRPAKALIMLPTYISNFSISATEISYNQDANGYVCIRAYPYIPDYIDPEYPEDPPYNFIDYSQPKNIYSGPLETIGPKNVSWQGRDQNGNVLGQGLYMFEAMVYMESGCVGDPISWDAERKEFEVISPPPPQSWSFAIITDLHVGQEDFDFDYGNPTWEDVNSEKDDIASVNNLQRTVELLNSNAAQYGIKFVVVSGDFSDSGELSELNKAKETLDNLEIPWIPAIGNHDIWPYYGRKYDLINRTDKMAPEIMDGNGTDKYFYDMFAEQYQKLSGIFQGWEKEPTPIYNFQTTPVRNSFFQNFEFDFNGYHFMGLDFNDREIEVWPLRGAAAEGNLHDFGNGTWRWLLYNLQEYKINHSTESEKVILLAHHPFRKEYFKSFYDFKFYNIGFSDKELKAMHEALVPYRDEVYALFSGHTHEQYEDLIFGDALKLIETPANVDGPLARLVQFFPDGRIDYSKMLGNEMMITAHSPIDLEVTDPDGLIINKQSDNYFEEDFDGDGEIEDQIQIPERKPGVYKIKVIPEPNVSPDETYSLDVSLLEDNFGYTPIILAQDVAIGDIPAAPYSFQPQERIATDISYIGDLSGYYQDSVNLSANLTDADNNPLADKDIVFQIGEQIISAITDSNGIASASLTLTQISGNYYSIETSFAGDLNYLPAQTQADFVIRGAKWPKQDALSKLRNVQINDKKLDSDLQKAKKHIEESLADNLWFDDSHITDRKVFEEEFSAVEILRNRILNKPKVLQEIRDILQRVIGQLVKADELLAKTAIYDAENLPLQNPKMQKKIDRQVEEAKEWLTKAQKDLSKNQLNKAIANLAVSWLHAQTAIKFAGLENKP